MVGRCRPDWVLAQGDTTTVLAAGLATSYHRIQFGHVEAGLRTGDHDRPFPEEINRSLADRLADLLFAPTEWSRQTLRGEGIPDDRIVVTGNTVVDALLEVADLPYDWSAGPLAALPSGRRFVLITAHRRESFGGPFREICAALRELAETFRDERYHFVYPVHLNPNVRRPAHEILRGLPNLSLVEPLDYLSLINLLKRSALILTDSGGLQEEAPGLQVPVLVLRDTTERPEGVALAPPGSSGRGAPGSSPRRAATSVIPRHSPRWPRASIPTVTVRPPSGSWPRSWSAGISPGGSVSDGRPRRQFGNRRNSLKILALQSFFP